MDCAYSMDQVVRQINLTGQPGTVKRRPVNKAAYFSDLIIDNYVVIRSPPIEW